MRLNPCSRDLIWCLSLLVWAVVPGPVLAAVIAGIAKGLGILTVAIVTKPFTFEGRPRMAKAEAGIKNLKENVDAIMTIPNDNLLNIIDKVLSIPFVVVCLCRLLRSVLRIAKVKPSRKVPLISTLSWVLNLEYAIFLKNGGMVFSMLLCSMIRCRNSTQCIAKRKDSIMNVMQLNTDIYNSLGVLSNDESYLEEALASINQAFTELKLHREGKMDFIPAEDLLNEL